MSIISRFSIILLCLLHTCINTNALAKTPDNAQIDCLTIQEDYVSFIESGKYRYTPDTDEANQRDINFAALDNYQQYLAAAKLIVNSRNPKATMPCPVVSETYQQLAKQQHWAAVPQTSQLVAPYELTQPRSETSTNKAILLIHGLTDSPYSFHDISQYFYQQGFTVRTLLLPGHGTAPSDLLDIKYSKWQAAAKFAIEQTLHDFDQIYLGGLSTGGALIFDYLMQQQKADKKIKGLFMWSPASKAKNDMAWAAQYVDLVPFVDWIDLDADIDFAKYESFPYNAAAQVNALMNRVVGDKVDAGRQLHSIPLFVVASEHDQTIDTVYTLQLLQEWQLASPVAQMQNSVLIYYGENNNLPKQIDKVMRVITPECSEASLCSKIFDVAHISTTNSPENSHYGVNSLYRNCGHYIAELPRYQACKENKEVIKGEVTEDNLTHKRPMQRLTYNPYYQEMLTEMSAFLAVTH